MPIKLEQENSNESAYVVVLDELEELALLSHLLLILGGRLEVDSLRDDSCEDVRENDALRDVWLVHQAHAMFHPEFSIGQN